MENGCRAGLRAFICLFQNRSGNAGNYVSAGVSPASARSRPGQGRFERGHVTLDACMCKTNPVPNLFQRSSFKYPMNPFTELVVKYRSRFRMSSSMTGSSLSRGSVSTRMSMHRSTKLSPALAICAEIVRRHSSIWSRNSPSSLRELSPAPKWP